METNTKLPDYSGITGGKWKVDRNHIVSEEMEGLIIASCNLLRNESEANTAAIASLPDLIKENEELKAINERLADKLKQMEFNIPFIESDAIEFGYKQCEKGNNIQMAFVNYNKIKATK